MGDVFFKRNTLFESQHKATKECKNVHSYMMNTHRRFGKLNQVNYAKMMTVSSKRVNPGMRTGGSGASAGRSSARWGGDGEREVGRYMHM